MPRFAYGHASHAQWLVAADRVLNQLRNQLAAPALSRTPSLGLLYLTDQLAAHAQDLLDYLGAELPWVTDWAGTVGIGIMATGVEYWDEPALAVMLCDVPSDQYRVFSGVAPLGLGFDARSALVHADPTIADLEELLEEMGSRTQDRYLFGGRASSRTQSWQIAISGNGNVKGQGAARGLFQGGMSGVAFGDGIRLASRVTQGCQPVSAMHRITRADHNVAITLDGHPALDVMLQDLSISLDQPQEALEVVRATLVGLVPPLTRQETVSRPRTGQFGDDVVVRHIIGLDPARRGVAVTQRIETGGQWIFCQRDPKAASVDLTRICAEIREELEDAALLGAIYISCTGRGGRYFGAEGAELQRVRQALGDVPLVGFFAAGEIAHEHLYGYTGVLTVFAE